MHYYIYIHTIRSLIYIYIHINNYYFDGAMIPSLMKTICLCTKREIEKKVQRKRIGQRWWRRRRRSIKFSIKMQLITIYYIYVCLMLIFVLYLVDYVAVVSQKHLYFELYEWSLRYHKCEKNYQCMQQWNRKYKWINSAIIKNES